MAHADHRHELDLAASLAFINTLEHSESGDREDLPTYAAALEWLVDHGAMHADAAVAERSSTGRGDGLERVRTLRGALREVVDAEVLGRAPDGRAIDIVNATLAAEPPTRLLARPDGVVVAHVHATDPLADALARVVEPVAGAFAEGRPERLRVCANDSCRWVFYDTSRTGRRRWCDMSSCGNRAKARRHRAKVRGRADGPGEAPTSPD